MISDFGQTQQQLQRRGRTQQLRRSPSGDWRDRHSRQAARQRRIRPESVRERGFRERLIPRRMQASDPIFCGNEMHLFQVDLIRAVYAADICFLSTSNITQQYSFSIYYSVKSS